MACVASDVLLADRKLVRAPTTNGHQAPQPQTQTPSAQRPIAISGNRILAVEDEALVAIAIREALEEQGYSVIGPCNRITDAMVAVAAQPGRCGRAGRQSGRRLGLSAGRYARGRTNSVHLRHRLRQRRARPPLPHGADSAKADRAPGAANHIHAIAESGIPLPKPPVSDAVAS